MSEQVAELNDDEFERLLADKKHKELLSAISRLTTSIAKDDGVVSAIASQEKSIVEAIKELKSLVPKQDTSLQRSVDELGERIVKSLSRVQEALSAPKPEYVFTIERDRMTGLISEVRAKPAGTP